MNLDLLRRDAKAFVRRVKESAETRKHVADHERRIARARELLHPDRIPNWTEDDLRTLFFDTDAFAFWHAKEREFQKRLAQVGLKGFQMAFLDLIEAAERGLTPETLEKVLKVSGLGPLLVTELLCYRFPDRYWVYHDKTLDVLKALGEDLKQRVPGGKRSSPAYLYFAARTPMEQIRQALRDAGLKNANFAMVDIFLWELRHAERKPGLTPKSLGSLLRRVPWTPQDQDLAVQFLQAVSSRLQTSLRGLKTHIGPKQPPHNRERYNLAHLVIPLVPDLIPGKNNPNDRRDLNLEVHLLRGKIWWGVYVWTGKEQANQIERAFRTLGLLEEGETPEVSPGALGYPKDVWGGGVHFALGHELTAEEVERMEDLAPLVERIAADLGAYYQRFAPMGPALRRAMGTEDSKGEAEEARKVLEKLYPDEQTRRKALHCFRHSILRAHQLNPAGWGVSLYPNRVWLVVGDVVVASLEPGYVWLVVDQTHLPEVLETELRPLVDEWRYANHPNGLAVNLPAEDVANWCERLATAHERFIDSVLSRVPSLRRDSRRAHSTGVLDYMASFLGDPLPRPEYKTVEPRVWIFQANPKRYDLLAGLRKHRINDWEVRRYKKEIQPGDLVLFWKAGEQRGIYGLGKVVSKIYRNIKGDAVVDVETVGRLKRPILAETLKQDPVLRKLDILRISRGTNFRVKDDEWEVLKTMIGEVIPPDPDARDARAGRAQAEAKEISLRGSQLANLLQLAFQGRGLYFTPHQIATFYTALQTKGFVILSGISGTGKTKLAQHFAALFPQPRMLAEGGGDDRLVLTVQPYMLRYRRVIVPKRASHFFTPPAPGETIKVSVTFGDEQETCRFVHAAYSNTNYFSLLLRGRAGLWFTEHFREGDLLYIEPQTDAEGNLNGFRLLTAEEATEQSGIAGRNWLFISVRPDWRDSKALLGYFNPLTGTYQWTPFLRFLLQAVHSYRENHRLVWFVILDEMNLARVEYYFGDLLSVLESGRDADGWTLEPLRCAYPGDAEGDLPPKEIFLPPNLYIVGTINVDETTHAISPKVLDRAFTLELTEADFTAYLSNESEGSPKIGDDIRWALLNNFSRQGRFLRRDKKAIQAFVKRHPWIRTWLERLNHALRPYELHFGYRAFDEIVDFLISADENGLFESLGGLETAFDAAVLMKVLPKFHGSRGRLEAPLKQVLAWCVDPANPALAQVEDAIQQALSDHSDLRRALDAVRENLLLRLPHTANKVLRLLWLLYTTGFAAF